MKFYVYVLHTDEKLSNHAQHYCGATTNLLQRLVAHATGRGARITQAFREAGIGWRLASVFVMEHKAQFNAERRVKRQKKTSLFCGVCSGDLIRGIKGSDSVDVESLGIPLTSAELAALKPTEPVCESVSDDEIPF